MEVEYDQIITINSNNFNLCDYFNKFIQISDAIIKIGNKNILINKDIVMKKSKFFEYFIPESNEESNIYTLPVDYPANYIEEIISFLYGCDLVFNINQFSMYYEVANYLMIDDLTRYLRKNLEYGFDHLKYDLLQSIKIIKEVFYIGDPELNNILLNTIANNFMSLRDKLKDINVNILRDIILRDDLNVDSELELVFFLNYYYALNYNNNLEINLKLIPNIRMLTLSISEINEISNFSLSELPVYKKLIDKSILSKQGDDNSNVHLIINYKNIAIPRRSVVINEFNKRPEITNYRFGTRRRQNTNIVLPIFPAIVIQDLNDRNLMLQILNDTIYVEIKKGINIPKVGSMILVTNSIMTEKECFISEYEILYNYIPTFYYKQSRY